MRYKTLRRRLQAAISKAYASRLFIYCWVEPFEAHELAEAPPAFEELVHEAQTDFAENLPIAANAEGGGNEQPTRDEALAQEDLLVHDSKRVRR